MEPGIYNLTAEQYHADPAPTPSLSSSIANIILNQSPEHAYLAHPRLNHNYVREEVNSRFDIGSVAHMLLLEKLTDKIVVVAAKDWRSKAAKEERDAAHAAGCFAILDRQYTSVLQMVSVARRWLLDTELGDILVTGDTERTVLWREEDIWYRCRPDLMSSDRRIIVDYKSTENAAPDACARQIGRMNYDLQAEYYTHGLQAITGRTDTVFVFLFQEIAAPYACSLVALSNAYRAVGQAKRQRAKKLWDACLRADLWPGYSPEIGYVEPKPWDLAQAEELDATSTTQESEE